MEKAGGLFLLGFASIAFPCVLPLVPGYLSAVSAVEAQRLGEPGVGRRVALASLPFILGFAIVFVALGAAANLIAQVVSDQTKQALAGFILGTYAFGSGTGGLRVGLREQAHLAVGQRANRLLAGLAIANEQRPDIVVLLNRP